MKTAIGALCLVMAASFASAEGPRLERAVLLAPGGVGGDEAGRAVAIDGGRILVGAPGANIGGVVDRGSAWVHRSTSTGAVPEAQLLAPDGVAGDEFGFSVAIDGDVAIVGAIGDDVAGKIDQGSASIFRRVGGAWVFEAQLLASDGIANDQFGRSVAIRGDTALVGAWMAGAFDVGAVYVYRRTSAGTWQQSQKLVPGDAASFDSFGTSIAFDGTRAIVGAFGDDLGATSNVGSARVFIVPTQPGPLVPDGTLVGAGAAAFSEQGRGVAIDGDLAVVGSWPFFGDGVGAAYVFRRGAAGWTQEATITAPDGATDDYFAFSVACRRSGDAGGLGDRIVCGAWGDDVAGSINQGSVWSFVRTSGGWSPDAQLVGPNGAGSDYFGFSLALDCEALVVGVRLDDVDGVVNQGSARLWWLDDDHEPDGAFSLCVSIADLTGDGAVDAADLSVLLGAWGKATPATAADLDGSGLVDAADLAMLLAAWEA
jgi:hypothetical protein